MQMKAYCFFYIRDKFQIYPAKTKREIDFKVDTVLHGLLWAKTGVRSNVIRSGTLKPFDKSLWKKYQRSQIGSSISGFFFMCLRFFFTLWRGLTLTWGLMEKRGCPVFGGGYCISNEISVNVVKNQIRINEIFGKKSPLEGRFETM